MNFRGSLAPLILQNLRRGPNHGVEGHLLRVHPESAHYHGAWIVPEAATSAPFRRMPANGYRVVLFELLADRRPWFAACGTMDELRARTTQELLEASKRVREEPQPRLDDAAKFIFADHDLVGQGAARRGAS